MGAQVRRFVKNALVMVAASLLMRTVSVSAGAFFSRSLGEEGMGLYMLIMSVYGFAVTFATSGVHLAVTRTVSEAEARGDTAGAHRYMRHAFLYALLFSSVATAALVGLAPVIGTGLLKDARTVRAVRMLGLSMIPLALSTVCNGYFTARRRVSYNAAAQVLGQAVSIGSAVWLLGRLLPQGIEYGALAIVLGGVLSEGAQLVLVGVAYLADRRRQGYAAEPRLDPRAAGELCAISLPVAFSAYIRSGLLTVEHALIPTSIQKSGRTRAEALADYGALSGMAIPTVLFPTAILYAISGLIIPEFAQRHATGKKEEIRALCDTTLRLTALFAFGCGAVLVTCSDSLGRMLYQSPTVGAYICALAPVLPLMFLDHMTDCMLKGLGEQVWTMWVNIIDAVASILLVMLLLPTMGARGYILVILLAEAFNFSLSFGRLLWKVGYRPRLWHLAVSPLVSAAAAFGMTSLAMPVESVSPAAVWAVARGVFCLCIYLGVALLLSGGVHPRAMARGLEGRRGVPLTASGAMPSGRIGKKL